MTTFPVLMYHSVSNEKNNLSIGKDKFYQQMKFIKSLGFKSVNLKDIFSNTDKKKIIITFDDGYEDVYLNAMPILKEFNFKATCFFVVNEIGKVNTWDSEQKDYKLMNLMNEKQVLDWHKNGFEIGSHTLDHKDLSVLSSNEKKNQIEKSRTALKEKFDVNVESFAYPFGSVDNISHEIVKKNYKFAVTTNRSRYKTKNFPSTKIPRIPINFNTSKLKMLLKIYTLYEDIKSV